VFIAGGVVWVGGLSRLINAVNHTLVVAVHCQLCMCWEYKREEADLPLKKSDSSVNSIGLS